MASECSHPIHMLAYDPERADVCPCGGYALVPVNSLLITGIPDLGIVPTHLRIKLRDEGGQPLG